MLTQRVDLFDSTYGHFTEDVLAAVRRETFGLDIGQDIDREDVTINASVVAGRWHRARHRHREALLAIEGEERYEGLQKFFAANGLATARRTGREERLNRAGPDLSTGAPSRLTQQ